MIRRFFWHPVRKVSEMCEVQSGGWQSMPCSKTELRIDVTLACGQAFRWVETSPSQWTGVFAGRVWTLEQTDDQLRYVVHGDDMAVKREIVEVETPDKQKPRNKTKIVKPDSDGDQKLTEKITDYHAELIRDYFQLSFNLGDLYRNWSLRDKKFAAKADRLKGVRVLRQDPIETLFTFICTSNNNIQRISLMVNRMCQKYGRFITNFDGRAFHDFPSVEALAKDGVEEGLRELGFGYRASYISRTAKYIMENHSGDFINDLRGAPYEQAKAELMKLHGVGAKVADCVCLMSLDKLDAVPVDTHVWQLAVRDYRSSHVATGKSLTDNIYRQIGDFFRTLWGPLAGWAQAVAFAAELKKFNSPEKSCNGSMKATVSAASSTVCKKRTECKPESEELDASALPEEDTAQPVNKKRTIRKRKI